jgi:hypothetical protein
LHVPTVVLRSALLAVSLAIGGLAVSTHTDAAGAVTPAGGAVPRSGEPESSQSIRAHVAGAKRHARPPGRLLRELRRRGDRRSLPRTAADDPRINTACDRTYLSVSTNIAPGATAGARIGETVYVRTVLWHGTTARWLYPPQGWTVFAAGSRWTVLPNSFLVGRGGGSVAPAIETWSASRGYEWSWSPPLYGRDYYWCDF